MNTKPQAATATEEIQTVGELATRILAHMDMEATAEVEHLLHTTHPRILGLIINSWYQMCIAHRGPTTTARTARKTMDYFQETLEDEDITDEDADAAIFTRRVLRCLAEANVRGYAELWQTIINENGDLSTAVAARILGFTRGMIGETPGPDCD